MDNKKISLEKIRNELTRLEDLIITSLFTRAQYALNSDIYVPGKIKIPNSEDSFFEYLFKGTERLHASAGRYLDRQEKSFFDETPVNSIILRMVEDIGILDVPVNLNDKITEMYFKYLDKICPQGDDNLYGYSAIADINCLQSISKRAHIGEQVAESKFQDDPETYIGLIQRKDIEGIRKELTNKEVERRIFERVRRKGIKYNMDPEFIEELYQKGIIPITKDVEIEYFLKRK